jgi:K(+)-stimulated pyrophosphate-energized sodium pump
MFTVGLGLIGATGIIMIFQNTSSVILVGFGFGGSLLALFLRVGGGIFTKAADVGADLVGKVEAGIPEDDPRNPATIADNVGDNVGDCAGMAADLFESYEVTLIASIILGVAAFNSIGLNPALGLVFPIAAQAIGVIASIAGVFAVKAKEGEMDALKPINKGFLVAGLITLAGTLALSLLYVKNDVTSMPLDQIKDKGVDAMGGAGWRVFGAIAIGLVLAQLVSRLTEYYTSTHFRPVQEIAESAETGPATAVLSGTAYGLESSVYAVIAIAIAIGVALGLGGGNLTFSLYLVALTGMGMLSTTGVIVSEDTFGPVSDNAAGIAEMSGEFHGEPEKIMVSLDAVGNTTKAVTKGFAIGSAVIAAVALFASFIETAGGNLRNKDGVLLVDTVKKLSDGVFKLPELAINVADPKIFIGLLLGGAVPFLFSALAIRAVGRTAGVVVQEVRNQFRDGGIMAGTKKPEYGPVIDICTEASLRELATPALLAVLTPVIVGFGIGWQALGGFLAAGILTGQLMANYLSNAGGAWDNAKKYIEDGHHGGKGSEPYRAAVVADTVGDPFKDTAGPALNPLIKVMNLVSLLMLPAIITSQDDDAKRLIIAGIATAILAGSVYRSSRQSNTISVN